MSSLLLALDETRDSIRRYCSMPSDEALTAITLWVAATHAIGMLDFAPRLLIRSPLKRSGKSRVLEVIEQLVHSPIALQGATVPYLFRQIDLAGDTPPTILLDEVDTIFSGGKGSDRAEALRGLLNAGFRRGAAFGRVDLQNHQPREFRVFAMVATASIGRLPDTVEDRSVVLAMKRRTGAEYVEPFRTRDTPLVLREVAERLRTAVGDRLEEISAARPPLPVEDRAADVWEPLVAIATLAGGDWPARAWSAALALARQAEVEDLDADQGLVILAATEAAAADRPDATWLATADLLQFLRANSEVDLGEGGFGAPQLARLLRPYGIRPTNHRAAGGRVIKGYRVRDFEDAWTRYLPTVPPAATSATPLHPRTGPRSMPTQERYAEAESRYLALAHTPGPTVSRAK